MKKPLDPWFEIDHDTAASHIGIDPIEWHYKRIGQNIKILKLDADINKIKKYAETFPEHQRDDVLTEISTQIKHGEVKEIFKRDKVTPKKNYTKEEAAAYLGVSVKRIGQFLEEGKLKRAAETRGNKTLIPGWSIIELEKIRNNK